LKGPGITLRICVKQDKIAHTKFVADAESTSKPELMSVNFTSGTLAERMDDVTEAMLKKHVSKLDQKLYALSWPAFGMKARSTSVAPVLKPLKKRPEQLHFIR